MSEIENINRSFYNKLYKRRHRLLQLIYPYVSYDQQCKSKHNIKFIKTEILRNQHDNFSFLDYGFGHGSLILKVPLKNNLFGCDISLEAVTNFPRVARLVGKNVVTFVPEDIDIRLKDTKLDMICLSHVIEHVDSDDGLLKSLLVKLAPTGKFLINVPINEIWVDPKHVRKYSKEYMQELADKCGLKIEECVEVEKWSGYFLELEKVRKVSRPVVLVVKSMRFLFALLPLRMIRFLERVFLSKRFINRQLVVLLSRK